MDQGVGQVDGRCHGRGHLDPFGPSWGYEECLQQGVDPAGRYPGASIETAMHAVIPHRVVLHVHSVNTIAWAVRNDAAVQLQHQLDGLRWQWVSYVASGLPLSEAIEHSLFAYPDTDIFVLGNHGLVIGGEDCNAVESLLIELERRLAIYPRRAHPADYAALEELCQGSSWDLPDDDQVHALGMDAISQVITFTWPALPLSSHLF